MATRLRLPPGGATGMKFIYNVSKHVGPMKSNPNDADDVQLVQFLIREVRKSNPSSVTLAGLAVPTLSGLFDAVTGFWIYQSQSNYLQRGGVTIDGIVSPARGELYHPGCPWVIIHLNFFLHKQAPAVFDALPDNAELRPTLRTSLR